MPKINVYVPAWLADAVKESSISVSAVCQKALQEAVEVNAQTDADGDGGAWRPREIDRALTNRARTVLRIAKPGSGDSGAEAGLRLLRALAEEGGNLALVVLDSLGVARSHLRSAGDLPAVQPGPGAPQGLDWLLQQAARSATTLGDRHIGCEHLLLALVADPDGPAARFLSAEGANPETVRQMTRVAAAAAAFARTKPVSAAMAETMTLALEDIRARLGRLEHR